ncbi:MAG TPA: TolC family protein, partial [Longimicrobiales bacterium]
MNIHRPLVVVATAMFGVSAFYATSSAQVTRDNIQVVTLEDARQRALAVSPATIAARGEADVAAWSRRSALTDLVTPNVSAGTSYASYSDPFFNPGTGDISSSATSATLQASYTIFGGGKFAALKRSRASLERAAAGETAATFRIALRTDAAYYSVLADQELKRVAEARLERAEEQLSVARSRAQTGYAIATDSLQLTLEVNKARLDLLRRDSALTVSRLRLGNTIGLTGPADAAPIDSARVAELPFTQEQAITELRTRGPALVVARANEQQANAALSFEREAYLPAITIAAQTGAYDSQLFPSAYNRSQFAVNVSLPIWNGGLREVAVARARAERNVAKAEREERERGAAEEMAGAYNGYNTARAATELARVGIVAATENYRVQRARYREGSTTILDLLEAQVALSEAESALVQSRYAARLALAQLEALLGRRVF